jgi:hypothetical protein
MSTQNARAVPNSSIDETNRRSRTIEGFDFDPSENVWRIATAQGTEVFNFDKLPAITPELRELFTEAFAAQLLSNAPERLMKQLSRLRGLLRFLNSADPSRCIDELTAADLQNYGAYLPKHQQYYLRKVKETLVAWATTGLAGLSRDLLLLLPGLETKNHDIGSAVRTMDPKTGPLHTHTHTHTHTHIPALLGHRDTRGMSTKISRILEKLGVWSHRTKGPMRLFQTRLRRTLGSRAAAEGHSAPVIADLMDHSWLDSSLVYIETRPDMIERIDKALALQIAPLAQAFAGALVERPLPNSTASTGKIVHIATQASIEQAGRCGKFDFCGLAAPLACYTCAYFNPWQDDIHETLLESLIAERDELLRSADARIASVNDRTILAVAEVVNRCKIATGKES